ncbi:sulfur globule protein CV1 domain protein [Dictyocaulus viviparus]|uniref:Sulfur globule protein CV1 domain protein n=1 Tax=Dictyocaulus viviparus TaxID=29172 RepID=A0A0D8XL44_DICVI|nr:sulfur globule protein CV1 domain protein [Dictyocaulus viviparus]
MYDKLIYLVLFFGYVSCQLGGIGGMYGYPYGMGYGMGMGAGLGMDMFSNPYGYSAYYNYRCRNLLGLGGLYNPLYGNVLGKRKR